MLLKLTIILFYTKYCEYADYIWNNFFIKYPFEGTKSSLKNSIHLLIVFIVEIQFHNNEFHNERDQNIKIKYSCFISIIF